MSTFKHTMLVVDRMHELCDEREITGNDRVRRLLAAVAHDVGKVPVVDDAGGLWSDDPPVAFGGHDERGAEVVDDRADQLGLSNEHRSVMKDACRTHMDVHEVPEMDADELLDFFGNRISGSDTRAVLSADELVDLACADREGRRQREIVGEDEDGTVLSEQVFVPDFDREPFERRTSAVRSAKRAVSGHTVMIEGLCDEHASEMILSPSGTDGVFVGDNETHVRDVLVSCEDCESPGPWVGDRIRDRMVEIVEGAISDA